MRRDTGTDVQAEREWIKWGTMEVTQRESVKIEVYFRGYMEYSRSFPKYIPI